EYVWQISGADADAGVDHGYHGFVRCPGEEHQNGSFCGCELDCIPEQVGKHLDQSVMISDYRWNLSVDGTSDFDFTLAGLARQQLHDFVHQCHQIDGRSLQTQRSALDAGDVEQVVDQPLHRPG